MKLKFSLTLLFGLFITCLTYGQGITTGNISGKVYDEKDKPLEAATVVAIHLASGTQYGVITNAEGSFKLPNVRIGGPYKVTVSFIGYESVEKSGINISLGQDYKMKFKMGVQLKELDEVQIYAQKSSVLNNDKAGSSKNINRETLNTLPQIGGGLTNFTKLTPQSNSSDNAGFGGLGLRTSNVTIDGSSMNNAYGLGGAGALIIGNAAGSEPISLDALSEIQINISPFDVRQGGFTGANINAVTRSGDNEFRGAAYHYFQNQSLLGTKIKDVEIKSSDFNNKRSGFRIGGPIIKNKLFFFANYERVSGTSPASNFIASGNGVNGENVTRVLASDLDDLSQFLNDQYGYVTGPYQGFSLNSHSDKFLIKLDYNINKAHKFSVRYNHLDATSEQPPSNSTFFGAGSRFDNPSGMSFLNSGWIRNTGVRSIVSELNSMFGNKFSNRLMVGYSSFPEDRSVSGTLFPSVDILDGGRTYISFGSDLFSNNNVVNQNIIQIQNDFSIYFAKHSITLGVNYQHYKFKNGFTPAWQGSYIFPSLSAFYNSTPSGTNTPIGVSDGTGRPSTYARRYSGLENGEIIFAEPKFSQTSIYVQDKYDVTDNFRVTGGLRLDITSFLNAPLKNPELDNMTFQDPDGNPIKLDNSKLPDTQFVLSPRLGFNWDVLNDRTFQVRGGTGIFNGISPFVAIGDAYLTNGINQGEIRAFGGGAAQYAFSPDVNAHIPQYTGLRSQGDVNFVDPDFKMPRIWKSTLGVDSQLPFEIVASLEVTYGKTIYDLLPTNANLDHTDAKVDGVDDRFRFSNSRMNHPAVSAAYVLGNSTDGHQFNFTAQLEKPFSNNWASSVAYSYGSTKDRTTFGGSGPRSAWRALPVVGNTNNPPLAYSDADQRHRIVGAFAYKLNYFKFGSSTISLFCEAAQNRRFSYTYSGLVFQEPNGDFVTNDLIFVPADQSQINLVDYQSGGNTITAQQQWEALDNFISKSDYLNSRRGKFAERNGSLSPWFFQMDLKFLQEFYLNVGGKKNAFQFTVDILNFTNMLNKDWGVKQIPATTRPIQNIRTSGGTVHRVNPSSLDDVYMSDLNIGSRWRMEIGIRYNFN